MKTTEGKRKSDQSKTAGNQSEHFIKKQRKKGKKTKRHKKTKDHNITFSGLLYDCNFCSKFFSSAERLQKHTGEAHDCLVYEQMSQNVCQCPRCLQYVAKRNLQQHLELCNTKTLTSSLPTVAVEELNQLKCRSCNVYFSSNEMLTSHEEEVHMCHSVATCPCCSSEVKTPNPNVRSIETQTIEMQDCDRCDEKFESKTELEWHRLKSHEITPPVVYLDKRKPPGRPPIPKEKLTCTVCAKVFRSISAVQSHMRRHTDVGKTKFECKDCSVSFEEESELKVHLENHMSFACSECGKLFTSLLSLQAHFKWHDREKDETKSARDKTWICHVCGQVYGRKGHLTTHLKRHEGIRSYSCPYCEKGFYTSHNLKIHVWTHTGERPYMCTKEGCLKRFTQKSHLKYHMSAHEKKAAVVQDIILKIGATTSGDSGDKPVEPVEPVLESHQLLPAEGEILTAESYNEQEVSTTPHVELHTSTESQQELQLQQSETGTAQSSAGNEVVAYNITSAYVEPASVFITEIHSYSEQTIGPKK